jgi:hypothetical protein
MNARTIPLRLALLALAAMGAGCASLSSTQEVVVVEHEALPASVPLSGGAAGFEQRLRDRAVADGRQGRLADAAVGWEILSVLRPDVPEYRERLNETRRVIHAAVPERLQRAQNAWKRGELDTASAQFLAVLALQPDHPQAADALRGIERNRNRSLYLGKLSRITLARSSGGGLQTAKVGGPPEGNELEHAAMLRTQGEVDAAIALLERHVAVHGADPKACQLLGDMLLQKARANAPLKQPRGGAAARASAPCP